MNSKSRSETCSNKGKAFCSDLGVVLEDQALKFGAGKMRKQLTEQTRYFYHEVALFSVVNESCIDNTILPQPKEGRFAFSSESYFGQE